MESPGRPFRFHRGATSFLIGVGVFLLSAVIEGTLNALGVQGAWQWADNCITAIAAGMIVYLYERQQHRRNLARLHMIAEMNHHIRNALQPLLYAAGGVVPQEQQMKLVRDAVDRIEWALTDILPG